MGGAIHNTIIQNNVLSERVTFCTDTFGTGTYIVKSARVVGIKIFDKVDLEKLLEVVLD